MGHFLGSRHNAKNSPHMIPSDSQSGHGDQEGQGREDVSEGHSGLLHLVDCGSFTEVNLGREGSGRGDIWEASISSFCGTLGKCGAEK